MSLYLNTCHKTSYNCVDYTVSVDILIVLSSFTNGKLNYDAVGCTVILDFLVGKILPIANKFKDGVCQGIHSVV